MKKFISFLTIMITTIFLCSCNSNLFIYNKFEREIDKFEFKLSLTDQIILDMNIEVDVLNGENIISNSNINSNVKMNANPLYVDITTEMDNIKENVLLTQEGEDIYQHRIKDENFVISEFYSKVSDYENDEYNMVFDYKFNSKTGTAERKDDYYIFTQRYDEALTDDEKEFLEDLYDSIGLDIDEIYESELVTKFKFDKKLMYMSCELNASLDIPNVNSYYKDLKVKSFIEYIIKIEEFEIIDLNNYTRIPANIDSVNNYSILNETYYKIGNYTNYYKYKLEKGFYYIDRNYNEAITLKLYDQSKNSIRFKYLLPITDNSSKLASIFEIKTNGDYYIEMSEYKGEFTLKKFDIDNYKKCIGANNDLKLNLETNEFGIINVTDKFPVICLKNTGNTDVEVETYGNDSIIIKPNKECYLTNKNGVEFINITNLGDDIECSVNISKVDISGDSSVDYKDLEIITDKPSDGFYICGAGFPEARIKLIVEETGYYTFYNEKDEKSSKMYFDIEKISGDGYKWEIDNTYLLLPGEYCITMYHTLTDDAAYGSVYYEFEKCDIKIRHEINLQSGKNPSSSDFPTIHLENNYGTEMVRYYFEVEKECIIYYDYDHIFFRNENDDYLGGIRGYHHIKPGRYYLTSNRNFGENGITFKFGIIEYDKTDYDIVLDETSESDIDFLPYINNPHFPVTGLFKYWFTLDEDTLIILDYYSCSIYDENGNKVSNDERIISLNSGKYYVTFNSNIVKIYKYIAK